MGSTVGIVLKGAFIALTPVIVVLIAVVLYEAYRSLTEDRP